jgi:hypothetical protein
VNVPDFVETITVGNVITWISFIIAVVVVVRKITPILKKLSNTLDDIQGERARPGVPARPGVMERLGNQDVALADIGDKVSHMAGNQAVVVKSLEDLKDRANTNFRIARRADRNVTRVETMLLQHIHDSRVWIDDLGRSAEHYNFKVPDWPTRPPEKAREPDDDDEPG